MGKLTQHTRSCPAYGNYQPPYEECTCGFEGPFNESCCDGGACNTAESTQPCGCDMGCKPKPHYCADHRYIEDIQIIRAALEQHLSMSIDLNCGTELAEQALEIVNTWK